MSTIFLVALSVCAGAIGNVLIKMGTQHLPSSFNLAAIKPLLTNVPLITGVLCMAAMFPFYALALQRLNLGIAVPLITSLTFIIVVLLSTIVLKEPLTLTNFIGILIVIAGLFLIAHK